MLYARSDLMSVSIPVTSGGCGQTHSRPVAKGVSRRVWELNCPPCESYLRGDSRPKVIRVTGGDRNKGIPGRMDHVADSDPHWSTTPETIPPTPDEENVTSRRTEIATERLNLLQAAAAAKAAGFPIPDEVSWLLEEKLGHNVILGQVQCIDGHDNLAGTKFCAECGVSMKARGSITPNAADTSLATLTKAGTLSDLSRMSIKELKEMCKDANLPTSGTKKQLVERLS